ncbi:MAG: hypothetical protein II980_03000 [Clostridia bacterium]|nr:hypothetical protein [Clostridia bacterium]
MGWFLFIITNAIILAVVCAVLYVIYNIIFNAASTGRGIAVVSFALNVFMLIGLISSGKNEKTIYEFGEGFASGAVGIMAATGIALAFALVAFFVSNNDGDDLGAGISESIGSAVILSSVAAVIQIFAKSYWPLYVLVIIGLLVCVITWLKD